MAELRPGAKVIFTTDYTSEAASLMSLLQRGAAILQKLFGMTTHSHMARSTLDRRQPAEKFKYPGPRALQKYVLTSES
jgi:hypothetical protein